MGDEPTNVIQAIARVMHEMPPVGKSQQSEQGYKFRGIEDVTAAAQKLMGRYCLVLIPRVTNRRTVELTINGRPWTQEELEVVYRAYGPGGVEDTIEIGPVLGLGRDNSDKGTNKAMTQAYKVALIQALCIGSGQHDGDHEAAHEADVPDPDAWFREHGWESQAAEQAWRERFTELGRSLGDEDRARLKVELGRIGFVWSVGIPKPQAEEAERILQMFVNGGAYTPGVTYAPGEEPF